MTPRLQAATALINLWRFLVDVYGAACALVDSRLQAARREYRETVCAS